MAGRDAPIPTLTHAFTNTLNYSGANSTAWRRRVRVPAVSRILVSLALPPTRNSKALTDYDSTKLFVRDYFASTTPHSLVTLFPTLQFSWCVCSDSFPLPAINSPTPALSQDLASIGFSADRTTIFHVPLHLIPSPALRIIARSTLVNVRADKYSYCRASFVVQYNVNNVS